MREYIDGAAFRDMVLCAYDALTAKRPYKEAYSADKAYEMIISGECGAFSEEMMTSFRKCRTRFKRMVVHGRTHV